MPTTHNGTAHFAVDESESPSVAKPHLSAFAGRPVHSHFAGKNGPMTTPFPQSPTQTVTLSLLAFWSKLKAGGCLLGAYFDEKVSKKSWIPGTPSQ